MKERPILFSAPMVRALLAGTKTQTRRPFKLPRGCSWYEALGGEAQGAIQDDDGPGWSNVDEQSCPYGRPGDRLWVRETWNSSGLNWRKPIREMRKGLGPIHYAADPDHGGWMPYWGPMKPSIHMPRWASRITLEVTEVRVERLGEISEADAMDEGVDPDAIASFARVSGVTRPAGFAYRDLWESINGEGSWEANPWVWVLEFKRVEAA